MNASVSFRVAHFFGGYLIDSVHSIDQCAACFAAHARRVAKIEHGLPLRAEGDARVFVRKESAAPDWSSDVCSSDLRNGQRIEHDEGRQILIHAAKPIRKPRAHGRLTGHHISRIHQQNRRLMIDRVRLHRVHKREVIYQSAGPREQIAHPCPRFALASKSPMGWRDGKTRLTCGHACERLIAAHGFWKVLVVESGEAWLVIPQIHLGRRAGHEKVDRALGFGRKVRHVMAGGSERRIACRPAGAGHQRIAEQTSQTRPAKRLAHSSEKVPARCKAPPFFAQLNRYRKIIDRWPVAAVIGAFFAGTVVVWFHLFNTESRFIAALATSIHEASSSGWMFASRVLSPTFRSSSARDFSFA